MEAAWRRSFEPLRIPMLGCALLLLLSLPPAGSRTDQVPETPAGLVVEQIQQGTTADKAGVLPGDILVSWTAGRRGPEALRSPFDLVQLFIEEVPRHNVTLQGLHGSEPRIWRLPGGSPSAWQEVEVRPVLSSNLLALYSQGKAKIASGELEAGVESWKSAATQAQGQGDSRLSLWFSVQVARALIQAEWWPEADLLYHQLIAPLEAQKKGDPVAAQLLREWGDTLRSRRTWDLAESCYRRALAVDHKVSPQSLAAAWSLIGLGYVESYGEGSHDPAQYFGQALRLRQRLAPRSSDVAATWAEWGHDATNKKDWDQAMKRFRRAVQIQEKLTPQSIYLAQKLMLAGMPEYFRGRLDAAENLWRQALDIVQREAPQSRVMAGVLQGLGNNATSRGNLHEAEGWLRRVLVLSKSLDPNTIAQSDLLHDLGLLERRLGRRDASSEHLCQALEIVERQRKKFEDTSEAQLYWGFSFSDEYRDCAAGLVENRQVQRAFETLERGRARSFLNQLAERYARPAKLPAEKAAMWQLLNQNYDNVQVALDRYRFKKDRPKVWQLEGELREIRRRKERVLRESLSFSDVRYPEPLRLGGTRTVLEPGTVLLVYSTAKSQTHLFVIRPSGAGAPGVNVFPIQAGAQELRQRVTMFREALLKDRSNRSKISKQGRALYKLLLQPADSLLAKSERILLIPDGPLHTLPFAALRRGQRYLIEWKPLHFALSATAYAELKKQRRKSEPSSLLKLVAFGDPLYRGYGLEEVRDAHLRNTLRRRLSSLPESRREVAALASLFPRAQVFVGPEATEDRARKVGPDVQILHFAVHGWLNEENPLNSALVLSSPAGARGEAGNGFLQAWEIMEDLHLNANLVTLSACDTALGREVGGEGLISLTRAFQYAGARSVLGTLWGVADRSTATLMRRFYAELQAGKGKDAALQEAQIQQIRMKSANSPFFWASFQLYGDWN